MIVSAKISIIKVTQPRSHFGTLIKENKRKSINSRNSWIKMKSGDIAWSINGDEMILKQISAGISDSYVILH